jgi:hypothetical protein
MKTNGKDSDNAVVTCLRLPHLADRILVWCIFHAKLNRDPVCSPSIVFALGPLFGTASRCEARLACGEMEDDRDTICSCNEKVAPETSKY